MAEPYPNTPGPPAEFVPIGTPEVTYDPKWKHLSLKWDNRTVCFYYSLPVRRPLFFWTEFGNLVGYEDGKTEFFDPKGCAFIPVKFLTEDANG